MLHFTKSLCTILIGAWLLLFIASEARADTVVFSNFGPGMTFNELQGFAITGSNLLGGAIPALAFTPSGTFTFSSAQLAMNLVTGPNDFQVLLMTSSGGLPGNIIETITLTDAVPMFPPQIVVANSALHPVLTAGTQYWLVAFAPEPSTFGIWNLSLNDFSTPQARGFVSPTGPWIVPNTLIKPAFQINGEPVPEPSTMLLLGTGLATLGTAVRKRRQNKKKTTGMPKETLG
ncbi:MAG TPA: PEP-CTERM sorting domain-containing protein [Pyrinomonadaceae bacterium]|nr:PEP-CTERM sorting domain-containing protein [Pyrinomonadaceae bacterium]